MKNNDLPAGLHPDTLAVRAGQQRTGFEETSEPIFLNSGYVYADAASAEAAFSGEVERFVYSRYANPTVDMFEKRLSALEGCEASYATASGMAAVFVALGALCPAGSRLVAARSLFGSCYVICDEILPRWGVETVFVDGTDMEQWREALSVPTAAVFCETPSNPMQEIIDVAAVSELAHAAGATMVVDNVFATPSGQRPLDLGADVVVYSTTKHIDGQGRVLGGAICGRADYIGGPVKDLMRHAGPGMSPFTAWVLLKGLETMNLRVERMAQSALEVARYLEGHEKVQWVRYPLLESHPQYELAAKQMSQGGSVVTFALAGETPAEQKAACYRVLDAIRVIDISNNLGDAKSLLTHPATSTHASMAPETKAAIGLGDGVLRLSVGLEYVGDLIDDLGRGLD